MHIGLTTPVSAGLRITIIWVVTNKNVWPPGQSVSGGSPRALQLNTPHVITSDT